MVLGGRVLQCLLLTTRAFSWFVPCYSKLAHTPAVICPAATCNRAREAGQEHLSSSVFAFPGNFLTNLTSHVGTSRACSAAAPGLFGPRTVMVLAGSTPCTMSNRGSIVEPLVNCPEFPKNGLHFFSDCVHPQRPYVVVSNPAAWLYSHVLGLCSCGLGGQAELLPVSSADGHSPRHGWSVGCVCMGGCLTAASGAG